jgi:hypothetical protein
MKLSSEVIRKTMRRKVLTREFSDKTKIDVMHSRSSSSSSSFQPCCGPVFGRTSWKNPTWRCNDSLGKESVGQILAEVWTMEGEGKEEGEKRK